MPFHMTALENKIAAFIIQHGTTNKWEYTASLESPNGPLLEIITEKLPNRANPGTVVMNAAKNGIPIVIHHNHLSQASLSQDDWFGLIQAPFSETHVHVDDKTHYWGQVVSFHSVLSTFNSLISGCSIDVFVENTFVNHAIHSCAPNIVSQAAFFRGHIIASSMKQKKYVNYDVSWGEVLSKEFNHAQAHVEHAISILTPLI